MAGRVASAFGQSSSSWFVLSAEASASSLAEVASSAAASPCSRKPCGGKSCCGSACASCTSGCLGRTHCNSRNKAFADFAQHDANADQDQPGIHANRADDNLREAALKHHIRQGQPDSDCTCRKDQDTEPDEQFNQGANSPDAEEQPRANPYSRKRIRCHAFPANLRLQTAWPSAKSAAINGFLRGCGTLVLLLPRLHPATRIRAALFE
jgi:hypothetical protein